MLQFHSVTLENFRTFLRPQRLLFGRGKYGLYQLTGRNKVNPTLGANGVGKSTVPDALCWCLYGKTSRGQRGNSVLTWGGTRTASVRVRFYKNKELYEVQRTQHPNSLGLRRSKEGEWEQVAQNVIDDLLGMSYAAYLSCVYMGQFSATFFDLKPTAKLELFSEVLGLDYWVQASDNAKAASKEHQAEVVRIERENAEALGGLQAISRAYKRAQAASEKAEEDAHEVAEELQGRCAKVGRKLADLAVSCVARECEADDAKRDAEAKERELAGIGAKQGKHRKRLLAAQTAVERATGVYSVSVGRLEAITNGGDSCPTCLRSMTATQHKQCLRQLAAAVTKDKRELRKAKREVAKLQKGYDRLVRQAGVCNTVLVELEKERRHALKLAKKARHAIDVNTTRLKRLKQRIDAPKVENTHKAEAERLRQERNQAKAAMNRFAKRKQSVRRKQKYADDWVTLFRELRLWIVEQALNELEAYTNNALEQLGLVGWRVEFEVERTTKAKTVSKGFNVVVHSPENTEPVPWESWSGGELQRLRIAGAVGFATLVGARCGIRCNLEFWDEPTAHLSVEGIDQLLQFLAGRATQDRRQVWLIDHRSSNAAFTQVWQVVRQQDGSHVVPPNYTHRTVDNPKGPVPKL